MPPATNRFTFTGHSSTAGNMDPSLAVRQAWRIVSMESARGEGLPPAAWVDVSPAGPVQGVAEWTLAGLMSNVRYATRTEVTALRERQEPLCRADARCAALIPIRKSPAWWALAQDERRAIFEEASHHTAIGMDYLPAIARQLFHSRDIAEPFDFLTWFEFAPEHASAFEELVGNLRATAEWTYVEREIDIRLERA